MAYPKKIRDKAIKLHQQSYSAEIIADKLSRDASIFKEYGRYPDPRTIRNWISDQGKVELSDSDAILTHDKKIYQDSNSIMSEESLLDFLWTLAGGPPIYYYKTGQSVDRFLYFFDLESNQYIGKKLKRLCDNFCDALSKLGAFLHNEFRPPDGSGVSSYARLLPEELTHAYYIEGQDPEGEPEIYWRCFNELQELKNTCADCLKQYRAYIRETLYI